MRAICSRLAVTPAVFGENICVQFGCPCSSIAAKNSPGVGMVTVSERTADLICSFVSGSVAVKSPAERRTTAEMALRDDMEILLHSLPGYCQRHSTWIWNFGLSIQASIA